MSLFDETMLNKYSNKIIKYIDQLTDKNIDIAYSVKLHDLVKIVKKIIEDNNQENNVTAENSIYLKKLHNSNQFPLLYLMFKKMYNLQLLITLFKFIDLILQFPKK
jgi:hypothetical protein